MQDASGHIVGFLHQGVNWVTCQRSGAKVTAGAFFNHSWAFTLADNSRYGWVNAVYARGGDNNGPFGGVPDCGAAHGQPPKRCQDNSSALGPDNTEGHDAPSVSPD